MKFFTATFFAAFLLLLAPLAAQDANVVPLPGMQSADHAAQPAPAPLPDTLPLIPDALQPVEKPVHKSGASGAGAGRPNPVKKNRTEATANDFAERIKFREAKTRALRDEKIEAVAARAAAAKTDGEKRAALKQYYTLFYEKILKIDGSLKKIVAGRGEQSLKQLDEKNVRPD